MNFINLTEYCLYKNLRFSSQRLTDELTRNEKFNKNITITLDRKERRMKNGNVKISLDSHYAAVV